MTIKSAEKTLNICIAILFLGMVVILFMGCGAKKIENTTQKEVKTKASVSDKSDLVKNTEKETTTTAKETETTITKTVAINENSETPIAKDNKGNVKDFNRFKKVGNIEFYWGLKNGKIYENFYRPPSTDTVTNTKETFNRALLQKIDSISKSNSSFVSAYENDKRIFIKVVRNNKFWLWLGGIVFLIWTFRKAILGLVGKIFPQVGWVAKIIGYLSPKTNIEIRLAAVEAQTSKLDQILIEIQNIKPGLIKT